MSYTKDTILVRDAPKGDDKFDKLRVIGPSPIRTTAAGEWAGASGDQFIVEPLGDDQYNAVEVVPLSALNSEYSIDFEPEPEYTHVEAARTTRAVRQLTPEEQFRLAAKSEPAAPTRKRTKIEA